MNDKFQPDFYVTCATVIPVFFLAMAFQGTYYGDLKRLITPDRQQGKTTASLLSYGAVVFMAAVGVGEFFAVWALFREAEYGQWQRWLVLVATLALLVVVIAGPIRTVVGANWGRRGREGPGQ